MRFPILCSCILCLFIIVGCKKTLTSENKAAPSSTSKKDSSTSKTTPGDTIFAIHHIYDSEVVEGYRIDSFKLNHAQIVFSSIAVGRNSTPTSNNAPTYILGKGNSCYTHPSVLYFDTGFNGFKYWMCINPYFGFFATLSDEDAFENPTIFCSNDGINWQEPTGGKNPLDSCSPKSISMGYWSDPAMLFDGQNIVLYSRGCYMTHLYMFVDATVAVLVRTTTNGSDWSTKELVYSTLNSKGKDDFTYNLSPTFINEGNGIYTLYDIVKPTNRTPIASQGNQTHAFVVQRQSNNYKSFPDFRSGTICSFTNRPWGLKMDPWHFEIKKIGNTYFMLLCTGLIDVHSGSQLYLAVSNDGINFTVFTKPLFNTDTYKSAIVPIQVLKDKIIFKLYQSKISDGSINLYDLIVSTNISK